MPAGFELPYYRMHMRPYKYSQQHRLLIEHEQNGRLVYYIAPRFHETARLNEYFLDGTIWQNSFAIRPLEIGDFVDDGEHHVSYLRPEHGHMVQSEPRRLPGRYDAEELRHTLRKFVAAKISRERSLSEFDRLSRDMFTMVQQGRTEKRAGAELERLGKLNPVLKAGYLARVFFDCELFVIRRVA